jgi:hypothetical protein
VLTAENPGPANPYRRREHYIVGRMPCRLPVNGRPLTFSGPARVTIA